MLQGWAERGGTVIAYGGGARWVQGQDFGIAWEEVDTAAPPPDSSEAILARIDAAVPGPAAPEMAIGARPDRAPAVPGTFLRATAGTLQWMS